MVKYTFRAGRPLGGEGRNLKTPAVLQWTENILKKELFENDDITITFTFMCFPCPCFPQAKIQNDRSYLSGVVWTETFDASLE